MTPQEQQTAQDFATELRSDVIAVELNLPSLGRRRSMSERHKCEVADHFGVRRKSVGATKGLYAPNQPEIKKIGTVINEVRRIWCEMTIQYRKGARLLRKERLNDWIEAFNRQQDKLVEVLAEADENYEAILAASQAELGEKLFDANDYPPKFAGYFQIRWGVHNFEPSPDLQRLAPETYEREQLRVRKQFEGALAAYESEAREQLSKLIGTLLSKLSDAKDGKKMKFTESAANNLRDFLSRFDSLGIRSDESLNQLVEDARTALGNTTMKSLKSSDTKREQVAAKFAAVSEKLETLLIESSDRSIDLDDLED